ARSSKMAALAVSVASTAALAAYFAGSNAPSQAITLTGGTLAGAASNANANNGNGTTAAPTTTVAKRHSTGGATTPATAKPTTTAAANTFKNGTYTGGVSQNRWGNVQVAAVYKGGKMVDVQVLQYPDSHNRSVEINQYALPILINDSLSSQSSNVNNISGATYTSYSYAQSLQSAIDAAKSASGITG
ncbi:MAG: FMN-binding protein, partial [Actinomycetota bacterium]